MMNAHAQPYAQPHAQLYTHPYAQHAAQYSCPPYGGYPGTFAFIVVLFILLIIVGCGVGYGAS